MMATGASLVSSWRVPSRAARVLNNLLRRVVRYPGWMCRLGADAAAVRDDGQPCRSGFGLDGPFQEAFGDAAGCGSSGLPYV
jgi:hypothetical protein